MLESAGASDTGCVRKNNEDYFLVLPSLGLYLVADGMGGAQAGEHASRLAAETVRAVLESQKIHLNGQALVQAFTEANQRVVAASESDPAMEGMGTTLVAAMEIGPAIHIASVGDSRVYSYEKGRLAMITEDQTWVNEVGRRLGLDESTLKNHPMRHVLTMAIGVSDELRVHTYQVAHAPGMQLLLCSDGLHGVVPSDEIEQVLGSSDSLDRKCRELISRARARGGPDNITAVLLRAR